VTALVVGGAVGAGVVGGWVGAGFGAARPGAAAIVVVGLPDATDSFVGLLELVPATMTPSTRTPAATAISHFARRLRRLPVGPPGGCVGAGPGLASGGYHRPSDANHQPSCGMSLMVHRPLHTSYR
jgi:hypothetical protein